MRLEVTGLLCLALVFMSAIGAATGEEFKASQRVEAASILPVEMLRRIPGPTFLLVFIGLSAVCTAGSWIWINADGTGSCPLPDLARFDPFAIAALRGGPAAVIQTAAFSLRDRKMIEIDNDELEVAGAPARKVLLSPFERTVYQCLQESRSPQAVSRIAGLQDTIERLLQPTYGEFTDLNLMRTAAQRTRAWMITLAAALAIGIVGGTKLYLGITREKPSTFLAVLLPVSLIVLFVTLKPWTELTRLGRRYLKALRGHFGRPKRPTSHGWFWRSTEVNPVFSVAIFGAAVLSATDRHSDHFDGGCGGGCAGGGGGGCGGGGCGGGCGGCGGCGG
ncbi:MAG: TIGR04222 domain-containing membrane protein [Planctomycetota bacterium]|jgi:uncharacterized protein (TIGR04222 family)